MDTYIESLRTLLLSTGNVYIAEKQKKYGATCPDETKNPGKDFLRGFF
jgi:hypothetical protein